MDRERILARLARDGFNELDLTCKTGPTKPARKPEFTECWITTELSPLSILWAPVPEEKMGSIPEDRKRRNFGMHAQALSGQAVSGTHPDAPPPSTYQKPYPTVVGYMLETEAAADAADGPDLQRMSVDLLRHAVPPSLKDCDIFGYGCAGGGCRNMGMLVDAGSRGGNVDELGEKFENVYPILIGPRASCEGLAEALGGVEKWPLFEGPDNPTYILSIPPERAVPPFPRRSDVLAPSAADPAVRRWLVTCDDPEMQKRLEQFEQERRRTAGEVRRMGERIRTLPRLFGPGDLPK